MFRKITFLLLVVLGVNKISSAQVNNLSSQEIKQGLEKLHVLGSVLYFAAHPDDENTKLIAWLAKEKKYKTAYLSLTRGDGGQNLIGTEQGIDLGLIRTQELLAARAIDGGEQYFTSAYDFGFSKTHEETFAFWDKKTALKEAVWLIRKLQPDVIITRFPPDKRGGHGHHQASAILAHEAFIAAADPNQFPEQLKYVSVWQSKRLMWNTANFGGQNNTSEDQLKIETGDFNPSIGKTFGEISARSRSQHKSQGFGAASSRGKSIEYFEHVAGEKANVEILEGINTSWERIKNGAPIQAQIVKINKEFDYTAPQKSVNALIKLQDLIQEIDNNSIWKDQKIKEVEKLILACSGFWMSATVENKNYTVAQKFPIKIEAIVQNSNIEAEIVAVNAEKVNQILTPNTIWRANSSFSSELTTQPYWLIQPHTLGKFEIPTDMLGYPNNPYSPQAEVTVKINGRIIKILQPITYRYVDPVHGELNQPLTILPELTVEASNTQVLSNNLSNNTVQVTFTKHRDFSSNPQIRVQAPQGWAVSPQQLLLDFTDANSITQSFQIAPTNKDAEAGSVHFLYNDKPLQSIKSIAYDHIPNIDWFPTATINCQNINLINPIKKVGYIDGAGDLVAPSLQQINIETVHLDENKFTSSDLATLDAVIVGVRYFNIGTKAKETHKKLMDYVNNGGVVLVQYNVNTRLQSEHIGPYPFNISRDRVTEEDAAVTFDTKDPVFNFPNKITDKDFENWVQERGLYFASGISKDYRTPIRMNDKGESANNGALLVTKYGKGKFVYTSLSFFRQLPSGIPGAYRLFVNLLSREK